MWINSDAKWQHSFGSAGLLRLILYSGELYRLPESVKEIRVVSGTAWLTLNGVDTMLSAGTRQSLVAAKDFALVSGLRGAPLVIELRGGDQPSPGKLQLTPCVQVK